jgi:hypothetical protein
MLIQVKWDPCLLYMERRSRVVSNLLPILEVLSPNLGPETGYPDRDFSWFSSVPPDKWIDNTLH